MQKKKTGQMKFRFVAGSDYPSAKRRENVDLAVMLDKIKRITVVLR